MNHPTRPLRRLPLLAGALAVSAFGGLAAPVLASGGARHATAEVIDTTGATIGFARFTEDGSGRLHVNVHVTGVTPGEHGIHLHAVGRCEPETSFTSAGGHFNPHGAQHGLHNPHGHHAGDLPNLVANPAGVGRLGVTIDHATLSAGAAGILDADGTAVVIHAGPDDHVSNPAGNSGSRVACGVIRPR